jgi:uncharacterized metal-binding protein
MSKWITSMAHFPKPDELSNRMPMALIQTTLQFGSIVKMAAKGTSDAPAKHGCGGKIEARLEVESDKIIWQCSGCADNGEISHWRGSGWESVPDESMPKIVVVERKSKTQKKNSRQGTLVLDRREISALKKAVGDPEFDRVLSEARPIGDKKFALSLTIQELDGLYSLVGDLLDFGPSRQRKMWDQTLNNIAWSMDEMAFSEAARRKR